MISQVSSSASIEDAINMAEMPCLSHFCVGKYINVFCVLYEIALFGDLLFLSDYDTITWRASEYIH